MVAPFARFARFVALCRTLGLLTQASVAIDGRKFKAVNNRNKNYHTRQDGAAHGAIEERRALSAAARHRRTAQEPSEALKTKTSHLKEKIAMLKEQMQRLDVLNGANARHTGPADIADRS